jgi:hypothetical protein
MDFGIMHSIALDGQIEFYRMLEWRADGVALEQTHGQISNKMQIYKFNKI